nr:MAG TPA: hypothetical protein [Bacteriophage sp.]
MSIATLYELCNLQYDFTFTFSYEIKSLLVFIWRLFNFATIFIRNYFTIT